MQLHIFIAYTRRECTSFLPLRIYFIFIYFVDYVYIYICASAHACTHPIYERKEEKSVLVGECVLNKGINVDENYLSNPILSVALSRKCS